MPANLLRLVLCFFLFLAGWTRIHCQTTAHTLRATKLAESIKVDGVLNEPAWSQAEIADGFTQFEPVPWADPAQKTTVRVLYDDDALYVGALLHDTAPDSILSQLTDRDNLGNTDFFDIYISCFRDGINGFRFTVTPSGVQYDAQITAFGEDAFWNAVWQCNTARTEQGWIAEFKIPYSALRFPEAQEQVWDVNFARSIRRKRELSYWNAVDPEIPGVVNQSGILRNISDIQPPVRLFLYPYAVGYIETNSDNDGNRSITEELRGGMDLKYGINDAYTLDMALIPDFGQVRSDNVVLNLTPFEVFFEEQRQFFTEGVELFNKGGLFYSRRIGGRPINYNRAYAALGEGETLVSNPLESQLINATKISGRNADGLGVGFFNAVTAPSYAEIERADGSRRQIETSPLTNYNVLVADQNLGRNSYVTLINSNVMRAGSTYDANVTGAEFDIRDAGNKVSITGGGAYSHKFGDTPRESNSGYHYDFGLNKISGKWSYGASHSVMSRDFDINDLGFLRNANYVTSTANLTYRLFSPWWRLNWLRSTLEINYDKLFMPNNFVSLGMYHRTLFTTRSFDTYALEVYWEPEGSFDYFEPRVPGRFFHRPERLMLGGWISTDYRRVVALDASIYENWFDRHDWRRFYWSVSPRIRFSDRLMFIYEYEYDRFFNEEGFASIASTGESILGERDVTVHTNLISLNYIFTNRMGLTFRLRHYWSTVEYDRFGILSNDGRLGEPIQSWTSSGGNPEGLTPTGSTRDLSYNAFNIDCWFTWVFSPGSELRIVWKNDIQDNSDILLDDFIDNLDRTLGLGQQNSISLRVLYFIDYLNIRRGEKFIEN